MLTTKNGLLTMMIGAILVNIAFFLHWPSTYFHIGYVFGGIGTIVFITAGVKHLLSKD